MSRRKENSFRPTLTLLENRDVPNIASISLSGGILTVQAGAGTTNVFVAQPSGGQIYVQDSITGAIHTYNPANVSKIVVEASGGTANFTASTNNGKTARLVEFIGGAGTDVFTGSSGPVSMVGGSGNDTLKSVMGSDTIVGGSGTDYIQGGSGTELLEAGTGSDYLNAGTGVATIVGGIGNDTIVAMNGQATDTIDTGLGNEVIWEDDINGVTDLINGDTTNDIVQQVSGFANGPSNVLNGGTFTEPKLLAGQVYQAFANRPLFASGGPTTDDVMQFISKTATGVDGTGTTLDDSWLLSGLGAIAQEDPAVIEQNVVNFGDGTFGVDLGGNYYRVDDKLPVNLSGEVFTGYASLGVQESMWVPIVEKAFAYYASQNSTPTYSNLLAANGGVTDDVYVAFGANPNNVASIPLNGVGGITSAANLASDFQILLEGNNSVAVGLTTAVAGTAVDTGLAVTLPANREYTVLSSTTNFNGQVTSVVLRDPSGNNPDGVTVTIAALFAATGTLDFGLV
jgi:hypothetical protein